MLVDTKTGTATAPATGPTLAQEATTGGSIADGTYGCKWTGVNLNGETTPSPETTIAISAGTGTARIRARSPGREWWTGFFAFNLYCGVSGGPWYQVAPQTLSYAMSTDGVSRDANDIVTITSALNTLGLTDGDEITVAGAAGCTDNPNGTFTVFTHVAATGASTVSFLHAGATESGCGGASITVSRKTAIGLSAHANAHYVLGDFIFTSVPGSGTQPPSTNTATIDDVQVAINTACSYSSNRCQRTVQLGLGNDTSAGGVPQYNLTTPLILVEAKIQGHAGTALSDTTDGTRFVCTSTQNAKWATDGEKVGCVMVLNDSTGSRMERVDILSDSHSVFLNHSAGGAASGSQHWFAHGTWSTQGTNCVAPLRIRGIFYYLNFHKIEYVAASTVDCATTGKPRGAAVMVSNPSGEQWEFTGNARWTIPAKHDGLQSRKGPSDPDRGANASGFPAMANIVLNGIGHFQGTAGGGTGIPCRCENISLAMTNFPGTADWNTTAGSGPAWIFGLDADGAGSSTRLTFVNSNLSGDATDNSALIQFKNTGGHNPRFSGGSLSPLSGVVIDFNSISVPVQFFGTIATTGHLCDPRNTNFFTNRVTTAGSGNNAVQCFGSTYSNTADTREGPHTYIQGGLVFQGWNATPANARIWGAWTDGGTAFNWWRTDPDTASQKFLEWDANETVFYGSDGTSPVLEVDRANNRIEAPNINNILYVDGVKYTTIAAAEAAASTGDTIIIPRGTYSLTGAVTFDVADLTVRCVQGASISLANATNTHMFIVSASGIRIEGCSLNGNRANQTTDGRGISVSADLDNVTITDNVITGTYKEAIYVNSGSNLRIANNRVSNCAQAAVSASNTSCIRYDLDSGDSDSFVWITNNDVDASASNVGGIKVVTSAGATSLKEIHIEGNRVIAGENSGQDTVGIEVFETSGTAISEARVVNNTVRGENNTNTTIFGVTFGGTAVQNCTITGNEVVDARAFGVEAICLDGAIASNIVRQTNATQPANPSGGFAVSGGAQRNSVTGNTCQNYEECFYIGTSAAESIIDNTFTGNIVNVTSGANVRAIRVQGNNASAVVSRNTFTGNVVRGSGTGSGVALQISEDSGTVAENTVVGNILTNIGTGVTLGSGVADTILMSNDLVGNGTAVNDSGSNTLRSGNKEAAGDFFHGVKRLKANYGTALADTDFALHANWGAGAAIATITGTDQGWQGTVTAAGTPGASPTLILTFKDGTWTNAPICISKMVGGTGTITDLSDSTTATAHTITFNGTPVAASTYIIASICIGR